MSRDPYSPTWPWEPHEMDAIKEKVERSSLGTPEAVEARSQVSDAHARLIVRLSEEMARADAAEKALADHLRTCPTSPAVTTQEAGK